METYDSPHQPVRPYEAVPEGAPPLLDAADIFGNRHTVFIQHDNSVYQLRITRNGKLILTK